MALAWTSDGMYLCLGGYDGSVSIRDKAGGERTKIDAAKAPIWSLAWSPLVRGSAAACAAACWHAFLAARSRGCHTSNLIIPQNPAYPSKTNAGT